MAECVRCIHIKTTKCHISFALRVEFLTEFGSWKVKLKRKRWRDEVFHVNPELGVLKNCIVVYAFIANGYETQNCLLFKLSGTPSGAKCLLSDAF